MRYHCASLFFPGSSIFLAWWCLCLLSLPSGCLLIFFCSGVALLLHPCCCVHMKQCSMKGTLGQNKAPESLPVTWPPQSGNSDYRGFHVSLRQHFALNAVRIVFAVCTRSWNFLLQTCSCEKGWQIWCVLQWFSATVRVHGYILGWQDHKALSKL